MPCTLCMLVQAFLGTLQGGCYFGLGILDDGIVKSGTKLGLKKASAADSAPPELSS